MTAKPSLPPRAIVLVLVAALSGCPTPTPPMDAGTMDVESQDSAADTASGDGSDVMLVNGCPSLREPVAPVGDPAGGDTWITFAGAFFATNCTRCHSSTRTTPAERSNAPAGLNWDIEANVRANLVPIRNAVGVGNYMPFGVMNFPCDQRFRIVRWIDVGAP